MVTYILMYEQKQCNAIVKREREKGGEECNSTVKGDSKYKWFGKHQEIDAERRRPVHTAIWSTGMARCESRNPSEKTVSTKAIQVVTGNPPKDKFVEERYAQYRKGDGHLELNKKSARQETLDRWQVAWHENELTGQWTKKLIPVLAGRSPALPVHDRTSRSG
ncbi:hypothetical protein JTB14_023164 [Gonioctena quinquepunctata]|nr:hypothetical protein JTB14_023164 [Gonioctena quinquepunctata]